MTAHLPARADLRVLAASPAGIAAAAQLGLDYAFLRAMWGERRRSRQAPAEPRPPAEGGAR